MGEEATEHRGAPLDDRHVFFLPVVRNEVPLARGAGAQELPVRRRTAPRQASHHPPWLSEPRERTLGVEAVAYPDELLAFPPVRRTALRVLGLGARGRLRRRTQSVRAFHISRLGNTNPAIGTPSGRAAGQC